MSIFSKPKEKEELMLVFDIRSSMVGGALFWTQKSEIPKIIFSVREPIIPEENLDADKLLSLTIKTLEIVADKIYMARLGAPSRIFCVLSSPWYVSQTRIISLKRNTPFVFNAKLADNLIQKEIKFFEEEHLAKYGDSVRAIELKNIKTVLNGYETTQPLNKKIKELEMAIFISMSGEQVLKKIENTIGRHFHLNPIKFISSLMTSFTITRDMYAEQDNFLLVDIGGEITDISIIKKSIPRESVSFPLGHNFLTREVAGRLGCGLSEANSFISLLKDGHAERSVVKKIKPIIDQLKTEWLIKFQESLANISNNISIPATVYMTIDREMADFFTQIIKSEQFSQYSLTESKFEVIVLNTELLYGTAIFKENIIREPFLIIDSVYINRFLISPAKAEQI
ncbi:TPA: hypothetical protein DEQ22_01755 [Candidatus Nomurabacteria bacterium]|uniref:SHS2 domain-containing protein n=1 Tax=Candidatus Nomurabacteria bacterium GW2011_GWF2_43_24 TaxID=1618778 RepID=A0A0G1GV93_9BACT|nr:MAG: hypothetical protein UV13_C0009G0016 [Parcubacteria group bacterium GW2011_GWC1_42_21]KKT00018.1 MAG: hypothetical protein UV77_C0008G0016 [Candidatus Nomurabacteria bacterium GW2011_GWA1_43_17]KKT07705.1 MAG: hypothetical protein UV85_C0007G0016 [Candidatus Nomurabacteria bacterium GW2011_GWB1_43_19]KKT11287.1 MAG: hypothetical protein UV91_C0008G0016 [Candidatus Nomurabacteria bacterium GW2011_GWF2_43_24]KKT17866.1 MAG: hypothetical protein UW01_C0009G0004 [Candidatus Nomurabacteria b